LLSLRLIERVQQRERLVVLGAERTYGFPVGRVERGLCTGECRRQDTVLADDRDVDGQVMSAELEHPRLCIRRCSEERDEIEILPEHRIASLVGLEHFIGVDDLLDLLEAARTERRGHDGERRGALRRAQLAET
jgi:hypothetical protein